MNLFLENLDSLPDVPPVELDLLFAGAAGLAQAAALALEVGPAAHQARRQVLELRQLDLQLALAGLRPLREDLEDQLGAVHHAPVQFFFQVSSLGGRELVVEHHDGGVQLGRGPPDLFDFPFTGIKTRIGSLPVASYDPQAHDARALHEARGFRDAFLVAAVAEVQADDDRRLRIGGWGGAFQQTLALLRFLVGAQVDGPRRHHRGDGVLVDHLRNRVAEQYHVLVEGLDLALQLDAVDEVDRDRDVLLAERVQ